VHRSLKLNPLRPRCLTSSLVLYRLLREQGDPADVVMGLLPRRPTMLTTRRWSSTTATSDRRRGAEATRPIALFP